MPLLRTELLHPHPRLRGRPHSPGTGGRGGGAPRKEKIRALYLQEHDLIAQTGIKVTEPLEHRENLTTEDLHHFVINFCLEMAHNNVEGADRQVEELKKFGQLSLKAIDDLASGKVHEPALDTIAAQPRKLYLSTLRGKLIT